MDPLPRARLPRTRPAAEVLIDVPLARRLVATQFPQWANLAVEPVESAGWDNTIFRLGPDLSVRLPRRHVAAGHVRHEHRWLPVLGPHLPLAVSVPLGQGRPGEGYPWDWTVCRWLDGELASLEPVADMGGAAVSLARFVTAMQAIESAGGPVHEFRGFSLAAYDHSTRAAAAEVPDSFDIGSVLAVWQAAIEAPAWTAQPVWMHGDLHPANVLVRRGELSAIIDFGLLGVGDPACDLMIAWTYLTADSRAVFRSAVAADDATWSRARGWALQFGLRAAAYSADNPVLGEIGRQTLSELLAEFQQTGA